jgi:hypothetical protein
VERRNREKSRDRDGKNGEDNIQNITFDRGEMENYCL